MNTDTKHEVIDRLPNIGERIVVLDSKGNKRLATIIPLSECMKLAPYLWVKRSFDEQTLSAVRETEAKNNGYHEDEAIRCFMYDDKLTAFCIMRFNKMGGGYEFNKNIRKVPT